MADEPSETVTLLIENVPVKCNKQQLIENSNYFKVMFEGNFVERDKSTITLEEIDLKSMNLILSLLVDSSTAFMLGEDDLLHVLQTSCMLQFEDLRDNCVSILTEKLNPENAIKIWFVCESHGICPLYLKAKNLALIEFNVIKDTNALIDLDLPQVHLYLANVTLQCKSELDVFTTCMQWYYENGDGDVKSLIKLLSCVDFQSASEEEIKEMMIMPDVHNNQILRELFRLIFTFKGADAENYSSTIDFVKNLFNSNKRNKTFVDPVLFVKKYSTNTLNESSGESKEDNVEVHHDIYKRKRKYMRVGGIEDTTATLFIYDMLRKKYIKCIDVPEEKYVGYEGFHIVGYKEQIFLFGGEVTLGSGHWNLNFWVYDTIRDRWERKTRLPSGRRHFQSCICGPYLYIIGGTGTFRIIQDNMFWYNYIDNIWSTQLVLPCPASQLRCCNYNDKLLLINVNNRCGYLCTNMQGVYITLDFQDDTNLVLSYPPHFSLFTYNGRIYVKSNSSLIEFELSTTKLRVTNVWSPSNPTSTDLFAHWDVIESIVCNDSVFTLYKCTQTKSVQFEIMSMLEKDKMASQTLPAQVEDFNIDLSTKMFALQHHYKMVVNDVYINELPVISNSQMEVFLASI